MAKTRNARVCSLSRALKESRRFGLQYHVRQSTLHWGRWLESRGRHAEAAKLYFEAFAREEHVSLPEVAFPYWRRVSPLFSGWVRCLVSLDQTDRAWSGIQQQVRLRQQKADSMTGTGESVPAKVEPISLLQATRVENLLTRHATRGGWPKDVFISPARVRTEGFSVVEMWPEKRQIYVWMMQSSGSTFVKLPLPLPLPELLSGVLDPLYFPGPSLAPAASVRQLQQLHALLFEPLQPRLESKSVLLVLHKELQALPFGMLRDALGNFLLQSYDFSYLPSFSGVENPKQSHSGPPPVEAPPGLPAVGRAYRETVLHHLLSTPSRHQRFALLSQDWGPLDPSVGSFPAARRYLDRVRTGRRQARHQRLAISEASDLVHPAFPGCVRCRKRLLVRLTLLVGVFRTSVDPGRGLPAAESLAHGRTLFQGLQGFLPPLPARPPHGPSPQ